MKLGVKLMIQALGSVRPCCDSTVSAFDAIFSDVCDYCSDSDRAAQEALMNLPINQGNTTGIPNCNPNMSLFSNLFSNTCTVSVSDAISQTLGVPSLPAYVWWSLIGVGAFVFLKR